MTRPGRRPRCGPGWRAHLRGHQRGRLGWASGGCRTSPNSSKELYSPAESAGGSGRVREPCGTDSGGGRRACKKFDSRSVRRLFQLRTRIGILSSPVFLRPGAFSGLAFLRPGPRRVSSFLPSAFVRIARTYRGKPRGSSARSRSGAGARRYRRGSFPSSTLDTSRTRHAGVAPGGRLGPSHASDRRRLRPRPRPSAPDPSGPERLRTGRRADGRVERLTRTVHAVGSSSREGLEGRSTPRTQTLQPHNRPRGHCLAAVRVQRPAAPATAAPQASMRLHGTPDVARNRAQAGVQA